MLFDKSIAYGDQRFTYDWSNRLTKVEQRVSGAWVVQGEYQYDALNRRVSKLAGGSGGTLTFFAYDGSRVAFEFEGTTGDPVDATLTRSYAYNSYIDSPLMMIDEDGSSGVPAGYKYYYFQDRRFSVVALAATSTTGVGVVGERYRYTAFGQWTVHQASGGWLPSTSSASLFQNPYGYTGRRYDAETATATSPGLWHYRNRMYSASLGRFLQRDPAGYIDGFNLYTYVRNNPLAFVDAFGLAPQNTGPSSFSSPFSTNFDFTRVPALQLSGGLLGSSQDATPSYTPFSKSLNPWPGTPTNTRRTDNVRQIVVGFDGTKNYRGQTDNGIWSPTNVVKLLDSYDFSNGGQAIYIAGVGNTTDSGTAERALGGATAYGLNDRINRAIIEIEEAIAGAKRDNVPYAIDVIGFSRGSAAALEFTQRLNDGIRNLANPQIGRQGYSQLPIRYFDKIKPQVRNLALFDTVGSIGLAGNDINPGYRLSVASNVQNAFHALSIDERRYTFPSTYLPGAVSTYFKGSHSDIGGGYANTSLSDVSLEWTFANLQSSGTAFRQIPRTLPAVRSDIHDSYTVFGGGAGAAAGTIASVLTGADYGPQQRQLRSGEQIHASVFRAARLTPAYRQNLNNLLQTNIAAPIIIDRTELER